MASYHDFKERVGDFVYKATLDENLFINYIEEIRDYVRKEVNEKFNIEGELKALDDYDPDDADKYRADLSKGIDEAFDRAVDKVVSDQFTPRSESDYRVFLATMWEFAWLDLEEYGSAETIEDELASFAFEMDSHHIKDFFCEYANETDDFKDLSCLHPDERGDKHFIDWVRKFVYPDIDDRLKDAQSSNTNVRGLFAAYLAESPKTYWESISPSFLKWLVERLRPDDELIEAMFGGDTSGESID